MYKLKLPDGKIIQDTKAILKEQYKYYDALYKANPRVQFRLVNVTGSKISQESYTLLEAPLELEEVVVAINHFPGNKTPRCDGLPTELYQTFTQTLAPRLLEVYNHTIQHGVLHLFARRGMLTLVPKKDHDILWIKNWRPLTMLTLDYKILSKVLDTRLKLLVLDTIIEKYQTGFMSGQFILENVLKRMEVLDYSARNKLQNLVMIIDFEKCFDKVDHKAISGSMRYFGIGEHFIHMVMLLFTKFELCTQNNGYILEWMAPSSGLHQGCCISPHLFLITGQVFAHILESNPNIEGVKIHDVILLLSQFTDDTNIFLKASAPVIAAVTESLAHAEGNLGLKVNYDKTTLYRMRSLINTKATLYTQKQFKWAYPPIYSLGINVQLAGMAATNLAPVIDKMDCVIEQWRLQDLTLTGRILVVNALIESLFV